MPYPVQLVRGDAGLDVFPHFDDSLRRDPGCDPDFSMVSADLTSEPVNLAGAFLPTYSGRGIDAGTGSSGLTVPGVSVPMGAVKAG